MIMKKSFLYIMAAVAAIAAVSCNKIETESGSEPMTITATFDIDSRTTPSSEDGKTYALWESGDQILVLDTRGVKATFTITDGVGTKKGTFAQDSGTSALKGSTLYAVYGDLNAGLKEVDVIGFTIPTTQNGSFKQANICVAKTTNGHFAFKNATAILHFTNLPTATTGKVANSVTVEGSANIIGSATASFSGESVNVSCSGSNSAIFSINQGNLGMAEAYYAVAPATISVIAKTFNDKTSTIQSSAAVVRNKIYTSDVSKLSFK